MGRGGNDINSLSSVNVSRRDAISGDTVFYHLTRRQKAEFEPRRLLCEDLRTVEEQSWRFDEGRSSKINSFVLYDKEGRVRKELVFKECGFGGGAVLGSKPARYKLDDHENTSDGRGIEYAPGSYYFDENEQLHREDGPAFTDLEGNKYYYRHGKPHREDGPAIIRANGHKEWWQDGQLHRTDGPAITTIDGNKFYYHHGMLTCLDTGDVKTYYDEHKQLHRDDDQPAVECVKGEKEYWQHGLRHRENGPAVIWSEGQEEYYQHGQLHRDPDDGPAVINADGTTEYWFKGKRLDDDGSGIINKFRRAFA